MRNPFSLTLVILAVCAAGPAFAAQPLPAERPAAAAQLAPAAPKHLARLLHDLYLAKLRVNELENEIYLAKALNPAATVEATERDFAEAYTLATWARVNLQANNWGEATEDVEALTERFAKLTTSFAQLQQGRPLPSRTLARVLALAPAVDRLAALLERHDARALKLAAAVEQQFQAATTELASASYWKPRGGGAGR